jgi:hypothetical protein
VVLEFDNDAPPTIALLRFGTQYKDAVEKKRQPQNSSETSVEEKDRAANILASVPGKSHYRRCEVALHMYDYRVYQDLAIMSGLPTIGRECRFFVFPQRRFRNRTRFVPQVEPL